MWRLRLSSDVITEQLDFKEALKKKKKKNSLGVCRLQDPLTSDADGRT